MTHKLSVLVDYAEEGWTSMDLCAEMLIRHLDGPGKIRPVRFCPTFRRRAQRLPVRWGRGPLFNADRLMNRFWDYPRAARLLGGSSDFYHVCDHSYSQLLHMLPAGRSGVYCHDLIAFRSILEPQADPRPPWFRSLVRHTLNGLGKARVVFCSTETFRKQISDSGVVDPARVILAPYGVAEEFQPDPTDIDDSHPLPFAPGTPFLLHVSTAIPRKRIDVLLDTFGRLRSQIPGLRLVQVGGLWTDKQREQIGSLGIAADLCQLRGLKRETLAALYRQASVVLLPSEAEGFGLPLIEALACGAVVVASDLEVFREIAGPAPLYAPVGDPDAWATIVLDLLEGRIAPLAREDRLSRASQYTWTAHAKTIAEAYLRLR